MFYKVDFFKRARRQLRMIESYYLERSRQGAANVMRKIKVGVTDIEHNSYCAQVYEEPYRRYVAGQYLISYRVFKDEREVIIIAILHGARVTEETMKYLEETKNEE